MYLNATILIEFLFRMKLSVALLTSSATYSPENNITHKSCTTKSIIMTGSKNTNTTIDHLMIHVAALQTLRTILQRNCSRMS